MAKFKGVICYGIDEERIKGVWSIKEVSRTYYGDWIRDVSKTVPSSGLNDNVVLSGALSILSDEYALNNYGRILYIEYRGSKWKVTSVEDKSPRLILTIGGVYSGHPVTTPNHA